MATQPNQIFEQLRADPSFMAAPLEEKQAYLNEVLPTIEPEFANTDAATRLDYINQAVLPNLTPVYPNENNVVEGGVSNDPMKDALQQGIMSGMGNVAPPPNWLVGDYKKNYDTIEGVYNQAQPFLAGLSGFNSAALNAATFGLNNELPRLFSGKTADELSSEAYARQAQQQALPANTYEPFLNNPVARLGGELVGFAQPVAALEGGVAKGLGALGKAGYLGKLPFANRAAQSLMTKLGAPTMVNKMLTAGIGFGGYEGVRHTVEGASEAGMNPMAHAANFAQGFVPNFAIGAAFPPAARVLGKVAKGGISLLKGSPSQVGLGGKLAGSIAKDAEQVLGKLEDYAKEIQAGNSKARERDIADVAELITDLRAHAMGGGAKPLPQVVTKARNVIKRLAYQNERPFVEDVVDRISAIERAETSGIIKLPDTDKKIINTFKRAIEKGNITNVKIDSLKGAISKLDKIAEAAEKTRLKQAKLEPVKAAEPPEAGLKASDTLEGRIEQVSAMRARVGELKQDPRLTRAAEMLQSVKGVRGEAAKAIREEANALKASVTKESKALQEKLRELDPDSNIRQVLKAKEETGLDNTQLPVDEKALTLEDIEKDLPRTLKGKAEKIAEAMKADKKIQVEYIAEEVGRSREAVKVTGSGNVKTQITEFTPTSFGRIERVMDKATGEVLDANKMILVDKETGEILKKGTNKAKAAIEAGTAEEVNAAEKAIEAGTAEIKPFATVKGYNSKGHEVSYYLDESINGSRVAKVGRILDQEGFRGTTPNVYQGQREYNPQDVLNRLPRTEEGFIKTSEAMSGAQAFKEFLSPEAIKALPPKARKAVNDIKRQGRFTKESLTQLQELLQNDLEQLQKICSIFGLS